MIIIRARLFLIDYQRVPVIKLPAPSAVTGVSVGDLRTLVDWTQRLTFLQILSRSAGCLGCFLFCFFTVYGLLLDSSGLVRDLWDISS